jgi:DNA-binding MarR family transcriptional regulator
MYYCYESSLIHDEPISRESIKKAAERYYHDVTEKFFLSNTHIKRPFTDKISIENQSGLLQEIINNAIAPKKSKKKHLSHFIVNEEISYLLDNLNLQGYISIFNQVRDRGMKTLNVYALDYGLCVYNGIEYHKPSTYTTQEINDSNIAHLITKYFNNTQIIKCKYNHEFEYELLDNIKLFGMICPTCFRNGTTEKCEVYTTNRQLLLKLKQMESIQSNELINYSEFLVLDYLNSKQNSLSAKNFSENVDLSLKTVENVIASLVKRELIEIDKDVSVHVISKTFYRLTDTGKAFIRNITPNN